MEPWSPGDKAGRRPLADEERTDRQPVGEPLRERDQIRLDPELLVREERSRPAHAGLHLVDAEQRPDLARELGGRLREAGLERDHAALPEHGLDQHERDVAARRERGLERLDVVRLREGDAGDAAARSLPTSPAARRRERPERAPVKAAVERDDAGAAGCLAGDLDRRLVRLRTGVAEERLRSGASPTTGRRAAASARAVQVRCVPQPLELGLCGRQQRRMAVAEPDDRDPGDEIEVCASRVVPHAAAVAAHDRDVGPRIGGKHRVA